MLSTPLLRGITIQDVISHLQNPLTVFSLSDIIIGHEKLPQASASTMARAAK